MPTNDGDRLASRQARAPIALPRFPLGAAIGGRAIETNDPWPRDDDPLNRRALRAALGMSTQYVRDLCALLRSEQPIHPRVRQAIADALEGNGPFGARLEMHDHEELRRQAEGYAVRLRNMEIGRFVECERARVPGHGSRKRALKAAAGKFAGSYETCDKAYQYFGRVRRWVEGVQVPGTYYCDWAICDLEERFHGSDVDGCEPQPNLPIREHDAQVTALLEQILTST